MPSGMRADMVICKYVSIIYRLMLENDARRQGRRGLFEGEGTNIARRGFNRQSFAGQVLWRLDAVPAHGLKRTAQKIESRFKSSLGKVRHLS